MRLRPNPDTHPDTDPDAAAAAVPPPGVETQVGPALDPGGAAGGGGLVSPWGAVASRLRQLGWSDDLLDSHAYDWRQSPPAWSRPGGSFQQLRAQIEARSAAARGPCTRVVLLGLSLGGTYAAAFLGSGLVDEEWKARHVERLVSISGVWGGTPASPWDVISGRLEGLEAVLDRAAVRALVRGLPSLAWTFPAPRLFGGAGAPPPVINAATGRAYGAEQLGQALRDAGAADAAAFWEAALPYSFISAPNVSTHCFYSYGLPSVLSITYGTYDFSDAHPAVQYGDGDVTVPYASLAACRTWATVQSAPVRSYSYYGVVHAQLTGVAEALQDIVDAVAGLAG
ncbi:hypothetical protein GPECTOR_69g454 [Gonium pectorale]|uniref:Serine aminopeptidase S33 domain-containing protein n=1 Tax=Gonium pectorale TaxID=33097 RepID=A0A150G3I8_GONPE|nr:hypothetical protein GPECTOR_69g454 [Gonium pectorale]|eukprot:KXZ44361.1 hypothetical protein GPECTOR_69g454 [Gonium pectorale]